MTTYALPALFTVLLWWLSTGVILCAVRRPRSTRSMNLFIATLLAIAGCAGLWMSASDTSLTGVYAGFVSALAIWGWHEFTFLLGLITGPRQIPCESEKDERAPLREAIGTVIYHELAIAATALAVLALTWGGDNLTGLWTYLILWVLRLSAKINVYLGVPNLTEEFLPSDLHYLKTYFCHRPMNMFFPVSVTLATIATASLVIAATDAQADPETAASLVILATLMGLALLEHWFLVLPFNSAQLWSWGMTGDAPGGTVVVTPRAVPPLRANSAVPITRGAP